MATSDDTTTNDIREILTSLCEDCDGKGYTETGGMAMEDDLVEKWPCDNDLHSEKTAQSILTLFNQRIEQIIGEDEYTSSDRWVAESERDSRRNELRAEQRRRAGL